MTLQRARAIHCTVYFWDGLTWDVSKYCNVIYLFTFICTHSAARHFNIETISASSCTLQLFSRRKRGVRRPFDIEILHVVCASVFHYKIFDSFPDWNKVYENLLYTVVPRVVREGLLSRWDCSNGESRGRDSKNFHPITPDEVNIFKLVRIITKRKTKREEKNSSTFEHSIVQSAQIPLLTFVLLQYFSRLF
jgi:hypothetical protein